MKKVNNEKSVPACCFRKMRLSLTKIVAINLMPMIMAIGLLVGLAVIPLGCGESGPGSEPAGNGDRLEEKRYNKEVEPQMESEKIMMDKSVPLLDQEVPAHLETATLAMG